MRDALHSTAGKPETKVEPVTLLERIGSTTFVVNVHFSTVADETMADKIVRLIEQEAA